MYRMAFSPLFGGLRLKLRHLRVGCSAVLPGGSFARNQHKVGGARWTGSTPTVRVEENVLEVVKKRRQRVRHPITTLDPRKLSSKDHMDISGWKNPFIHIGELACYLGYYHQKQLIPFPQDTRGFLYYHIPQNSPAAAGQVRFRLTRDGGPEAFDTASDLLGRYGLPWSIPLWRIASQSRYSPIQSLLIKEELVSEELLVRSRELLPPLRMETREDTSVIYALGQPVPIALGHRTLRRRRLVVIGRSSVKLLSFSKVAFTSSEQPGDTSSPDDYIHVSIGHDPRRNRFFTQTIAKFEVRSRTLVPLKGEPMEIRQTDTTHDPYDALCLLLDEHSSSETLEQKPSLRYTRPVSTLDPSRLQPLDFVDLVSHPLPFIRIGRCAIRLGYCTRGTMRGAFPANARGFLYYFRPKNLPETAGAVRFRQMPDDEPSNFSQGSDLLLPQGIPWSLPIWFLAFAPGYAAICQSLIQDDLIDRNLVGHCRDAFPPSVSRYQSMTVIFALGQPFSVRFGKRFRTIWIADADGALGLTLALPFLKPFTTKEAIPTGLDPLLSALVCIERQGANLVVRILDIPEPFRGKTSAGVGDTTPLTYRQTSSAKDAVRKLLSLGGSS